MTWNLFERFWDALRSTSRTERAPEPPTEVSELDMVPLAPVVIASPEDALPTPSTIDQKGWINHANVIVIPSRRSWYYAKLDTSNGLPKGIVAHYTATNSGTAMNMAVRRRDHDRTEWPPGERPGSWHFTVPQKGPIIQQLSIRQGAFHAGSPTARRLPIGWANHVALGIELEGHGDVFTPHQIGMAKWLWREIIKHCLIPRQHAMSEHSWIDPDRRRDPGSYFMSAFAPSILDHAYTSGES